MIDVLSSLSVFHSTHKVTFKLQICIFFTEIILLVTLEVLNTFILLYLEIPIAEWYLTRNIY